MKFRKFLHAKIHHARVTHLSPDYEASISIDKNILNKANIEIGEEVLVADVETGIRFVTYAIEAPSESGVIGINGAAANMHIEIEDRLIIMAFEYIEHTDTRAQPKIIVCDEDNKVKTGS